MHIYTHIHMYCIDTRESMMTVIGYGLFVHKIMIVIIMEGS